MTEMVVAVFDSPSAAAAAIRDLEAARIPSADIKSYSQDDLASTQAITGPLIGLSLVRNDPIAIGGCFRRLLGARFGR